jgi:predicted dehydrogenase
MQWEDGLLGTVEILGGVNSAYFEVQVYGSECTLRCTIPKGDVQDLRGAAVGDADHCVEEGYSGTMDAFIAMCRTREMPVPLEEMETIARSLLAVRLAAMSGQPVSLDSVVL